MNSLFEVVRAKPASESVFKFGFKLGGSEDVEDDAPTKKKNKNKKKKKKSSAGVASNEADNDDSVEPDNTEIDTLVDGLVKEVAQVMIVEQASATEESPSESATLTKSQKKNMQKKKAKKLSDSIEDVQNITKPSSSASAIEPPKPKGKQAKAVPPSKSKEVDIASIDDIDEILLSIQKEVSTSPIKAPKPKPAKPSQSSAPLAGAAFAQSASPPPRGPHFISSKDPELDEASKLRFKYGMGRNLVAIGPAKVRDPNWLPPPPGLTRNVDGLVGSGGVTLGNKGISRIASPVKKVPAKISADGPEEHSSPFSFSFNGL